MLTANRNFEIEAEDYSVLEKKEACLFCLSILKDFHKLPEKRQKPLPSILWKLPNNKTFKSTYITAQNDIQARRTNNANYKNMVDNNHLIDFKKF